MKLLDNQTNETFLASLGLEAVRLVKDNNYRGLAERFGYALAYGKDPVDAIQSEIAACLSNDEGCARLLASGDVTPVVRFFKPNDTGLYALVECALPLSGEAGKMLVELIVTSKGSDKYVTLEQISYCA